MPKEIRLFLNGMLEGALSIGYLAIAIQLIRRWKIFRVDGLRSWVMPTLFLIKIVAALGLVWIYTVYYPSRAYADIFRYYDDSAVLYGALTDAPWDFFRMLTGIDAGSADLSAYYERMRNWFNTDLPFKDTRTIIRVCAFLRLFSMGTYFPLAIVLSFLAFTGLAGIFNVFRKYLPGRDALLVGVVFLLPSVLLWTSGIIKEAFLYFAIGWTGYQIHRLLEEKRFSGRRLFNLLIAAFILVTIKAYVFFLLLPLWTVWYLTSGGCMRVTAPSIISVFLAWYVSLALITPAVTGLPLPQLLADKQAEFYSVAETGGASSLIDIGRLDGTWTSVFRNMPNALLRSLFYPLPQHAGNMLVWFSLVENGLYVLFMVWMICIALARKSFSTSPLLLSGLCFAIALFIFIGLVTPIIGALVRYKVPALPFLLLFFCSIVPPSDTFLDRIIRSSKVVDR